MKIYKKQFSHSFFAIIILTSMALILFIILFFGKYFSETPSLGVDDYYTKLNAEGDNFTLRFQDELPSILVDVGVDGAMQILEKGGKEGIIDMVNCHPLIHLIGHEAQKSGQQNLTELVRKYGSRCQVAFEHGIEAQIAIEVLNPTDRSTELIKSCKRYQSVGGGLCYHGAGHAFYQMTNDAEKAVKHCDSIGDPQQESIDDCYRGIFSEFGNQVLGVDGETGLEIPGPKKQLEDNGKPLTHCYKYEKKYQESCFSQFTKISYVQTKVMGDFLPCLFDDYTPQAQNVCMKILAGITARAELTHNDSYVIPSELQSLDQELQKSYILGIKDALTGYSVDGIKKDWKVMCGYFSGSVEDYCIEQLKTTERA